MRDRDGNPDEGMKRDLAALHESAYGWALSCCAFDEQEAKDVLQSAYLAVIEGKARFYGRSSLRTFFFSVVRNIAAGRRRQSGRRRSLLAWWRPRQLAAPPAAEGRGLRHALAQLPDRQREVLQLVFAEELSLSEAAEVMGVSLGSARTHYARAKERMREILGESDG